MQGTNERWSTL